jgi:Transposase DDE domain
VVVVDASLIKLSLDALDWAKYLEHAGAAKITLRLVSYQLTDGKLIRVLTDHHELSAISIALLYKKRRTIETLFGALKSRGFNLEYTRLKGAERLSRLLALLELAFTWAFVVGLWQASIKELKSRLSPRRVKPGRRFVRRFGTP